MIANIRTHVSESRADIGANFAAQVAKTEPKSCPEGGSNNTETTSLRHHLRAPRRVRRQHPEVAMTIALPAQLSSVEVLFANPGPRTGAERESPFHDVKNWA